MTTSGTRTPACAAISVASASCSTCSSRPMGALRGGSRYARSRQRRATRCVSCASRPSTRTFSGPPSAPCAKYSVAPICWRSAISRSLTWTPSDSSAAAHAVHGRRPERRTPTRAGRAPQRPDRARVRRGRPPGARSRAPRTPSDASPTSQTATHARGTHQLGASDRDDCHDTCDTELGEPPVRQGIRLERKPVGVDDASPERSPPRSREAVAMNRSRTSSHRRWTRASATMRSASASVTTSSARQSPGAQPRSVPNACPISSSVAGSRPSDHGVEPEHGGGGRDQNAVNRPPVPRPGSAGTSRARMAMAGRLPRMAQSGYRRSRKPPPCRLRRRRPSSLRSLERDAPTPPTHRPGRRLGRRRARQARRSRAQPRRTRHVRPQPAAHARRSTGCDRVSRAGAGGRRDRRRCRLPPMPPRLQLCFAGALAAALLARSARVRPVRLLRRPLARPAAGARARPAAGGLLPALLPLVPDEWPSRDERCRSWRASSWRSWRWQRRGGCRAGARPPGGGAEARPGFRSPRSTSPAKGPRSRFAQLGLIARFAAGADARFALAVFVSDGCPGVGCAATAPGARAARAGSARRARALRRAARPGRLADAVRSRRALRRGDGPRRDGAGKGHLQQPVATRERARERRAPASREPAHA